ncbi:MAG: o-succinylbenzoate synthase, partial [Paludibacteraceae bacterium]|nr:o-succinylbenzoate synthase [Paludibacteraceae bacterium]
KFAFECAEMQLKNGSEKIFDTPFCNGKDGIRINGLVWMGEIDVMLRRAKEKYDLGFRCLKFKIGSKNFNKEMNLLKAMRAEFGNTITMRVDANCAYTPDFYLQEVEPVLHSLDIHSIEQPVKVADVAGLTYCCAKSRVDIALDESLIGTKSADEMAGLLDTVKPQYIILKPTLCGGLSGANQWIKTAKERGIGYWATSALESNVGLLAIAQWSSTIGVDIPQGLGTGMIYSNNIDKGLHIEGEKLWWKGTTTR